MQIFKDSETALGLPSRLRKRFINYTESVEVKRLKRLLNELKIRYEGPRFISDEIVDIVIKRGRKTIVIDVPSKDRRGRALQRAALFKEAHVTCYPVLPGALNKCGDEKVKSDLLEILK